MKISADQLAQESLTEFGALAAKLLATRELRLLSEQFWYALAFGREPAAAIAEDLARCNAAIYGGMLVSAGLTQYQLSQSQQPAAWSFVGFFIGFAVMLAIKFSTKCPSCKGNVGSTLMNSGHFISLPKKIKYCPLCGVDIDAKQ